MTEVHFYKPDLTGNMAPQAITFASNHGAAMTIHQDGRITLGENAQPTEAAAACIDAMSHMIQDMIRNAVEAEKKQLTRENGYLLKEQALAYIAQNERLRERADALALQADEWEGKYAIVSEMNETLRAEVERWKTVHCVAVDHEVTDVEIEDALKSEGIYVWGPDGERFQRMFAVVMKLRAALASEPGK